MYVLPGNGKNKLFALEIMLPKYHCKFYIMLNGYGGWFIVP